MSKRLHAVMIGYASLELVKEAIELFERQNIGANIASRTFVDCHFPLPTQEEVAEVTKVQCLAHIAMTNGWDYIRPLKNRGFDLNLQWTIDELGLGDGDVMLLVDADGRSQQDGWAMSFLDLFNNAPEAIYCCMNRSCIYSMRDAHPFFERKVGSNWILDYTQLISWCLGGFDVGWVRKIGGFKPYHPWYGYVEFEIMDRAKPMGGKFYVLRDFYDKHLGEADQGVDPRYKEWKHACAARQTNQEFGEWLKGRQ